MHGRGVTEVTFETFVNVLAVWTLVALFLTTIWLAWCTFHRAHFPCDEHVPEYPRSNVRVIPKDES